MSGRWEERSGLPERRATAALVPPTAHWLARVEDGISVALRRNTGDARAGLQQLYEAVRERVVELRRDGLRVEQVLMAVKREVGTCMTATPNQENEPDPSRVAALLDGVVRWCVGTYYLAN